MTDECLEVTTKAGVAYRDQEPSAVSVSIGTYPGVVLLDVTEADESNSASGWLDKAMLEQHIRHCTDLLARLP